MIAELGHYALVLALGLALVQACVPFYGARSNDPVLMARRRSDRGGAVRVRGDCLRRAHRLLRALGFLRRQRVRELALARSR